MLRDDEAFPMALPIHKRVYEEEIVYEARYTNDDFDDVFGSAPPSPTARDDDGVWHRNGGNAEPSDVPRLREKHETEGYRDGVTKGKAETVQAGFDEGYGLGATLGLKIGKILGLLEGISRAVASIHDGEGERLGKLLGEAKLDLRTENVFAREWWGEDGIWKFEVPGREEVTFPDVAGAHPLVRKWQRIVEGEVEKWGLDLGVMDEESSVPGPEKSTEGDMNEGVELPRKLGAQRAEFSW